MKRRTVIMATCSLGMMILSGCGGAPEPPPNKPVEPPPPPSQDQMKQMLDAAKKPAKK